MNPHLKTLAKKLKTEKTAFFRVKITPRSEKTEFAEVLETDNEPTQKIRVAAPPEHGKANQKLCKFLEKHFNAEAKIISGHTNSIKLVKLSAN